MKSGPCILFTLALPAALAAQTNIGGVVNSYHRVVELLPASACVRVDLTAGLAPNKLVMLVQMKGATVNTSNLAAFGSLSNLAQAGNYEINSVCAVRGDSVFLLRQFAQAYTAGDKVQLVAIPQYLSANVTATLMAQPWDSASGKGGVLAISVVNDLVLNAPISANGAGYKGGAFVASSGVCFNAPLSANNFSYDPSATGPQNGAWKGESVASLSAGFRGGKGAAANGGGGGNNHNNGGGGGANLSAGGGGGGNSSGTGCRTPNAAIGGYALNSSGGNKLFLGGGGGAGHVNNGTSGGGGNGGGIVFIIANQLISNGYSISANGSNGAGAMGDGASGGGAGGTVVLNVNSYAGVVNLEASGGNGGNEDDQSTNQRCYGEGGGGSGGVVYFKNAVPAGAISVTGGTRGLRLNSLNCGTLVLGSNGSVGSMVTNYTYVQSAVLSTSCTVPLAVQLQSFDVRAQQKAALMQWNVSEVGSVATFVVERKRGEGPWQQLAVMMPITGNSNYLYRDQGLSDAVYYYRLRITEKSGRIYWSEVKKLVFGNNQLLVYPNPAVETVTIQYPFSKGSLLRIYDALGQLVWEKRFTSPQPRYLLSASFLRKGVYQVDVSGKKIKLVIQ